MTPEDFAAFIVGSDDWKEPNEGMFGGYGIDVNHDVLTRMIANAIRVALNEELEACAKVAESVKAEVTNPYYFEKNGYKKACDVIAEAIRERSHISAPSSTSASSSS